MDAVIQSPSAKSEMTGSPNHLQGVDFGALALKPPIGGAAANEHNIFSFGSSSAWGTGGGASAAAWGAPASDGWGAPVVGRSSNTGGIAGSRWFGSNDLGFSGIEGNSVTADGEDHDEDTFLSLTTGIPGFLTGGGDEDGNGGD